MDESLRGVDIDNLELWHAIRHDGEWLSTCKTYSGMLIHSDVKNVISHYLTVEPDTYRIDKNGPTTRDYEQSYPGKARVNEIATLVAKELGYAIQETREQI